MTESPGRALIRMSLSLIRNLLAQIRDQDTIVFDTTTLHQTNKCDDSSYSRKEVVLPSNICKTDQVSRSDEPETSLPAIRFNPSETSQDSRQIVGFKRKRERKHELRSQIDGKRKSNQEKTLNDASITSGTSFCSRLKKLEISNQAPGHADSSSWHTVIPRQRVKEKALPEPSMK